MVTQITPSQSFEVHPYNANDANKADDKEDPLFSFHVSCETRTSPFLRTGFNGFWLQRVVQFALKILFFFIIGDEATGAGERKREKDCLESETHFKGFPKNSLRNLR